ncbi:MAG: hypothetical protein M3Q89_07760 [Verrucomicrobiota bacterium]|nr:hypothetical protein [Verrucomicrobiota bacterium]
MKKRMIQHAKELLKKVPGARFYALGEREWLAIAALLTSWQEERRASGINFDEQAATEFLAEVVAHIPSLKQDRPADEEKLAQLWRDPVTGEAPKNPYAKDTLNVTEQMEIAKEQPELAAYLKATADGVTYTYLRKQREEKETRALLRDLPYGEAEHIANPLRGSDLPTKARFHKEHHPAVVEFYRRETQPVSLFWLKENVTERMAVAKSAPHLQMLADQAAEVKEAWGADELQTLRGEEAELARKRAVAESLLKQQ